MDDATRLRLALQRTRVRYAPDDRVAVFDLRVDDHGSTPTLTGTVSDNHLRMRALQVTDCVIDTYDASIRVLSDNAVRKTIQSGPVAVRDVPSSDGERMTEILQGAAIEAYNREDATAAQNSEDDWLQVRAPDGYVGWVRAAAVTDPADVSPDHTLRSSVETEKGTLYPGTEIHVIDSADDTRRVALRTGERYTVPTSAVIPQEPPADASGSAVVTVARSYLGTPYRWGGMTTEGIDCSGLVWLAYRVTDVTLPRDADQQRHMGREVDRNRLEPGDLLFFPGHVAISLGDERFVHAYGDAESVVVNSLDSGDDDYLDILEETFAMATRIFS